MGRYTICAALGVTKTSLSFYNVTLSEVWGTGTRAFISGEQRSKHEENREQGNNSFREQGTKEIQNLI